MPVQIVKKQSLAFLPKDHQNFIYLLTWSIFDVLFVSEITKNKNAKNVSDFLCLTALQKILE